MLKLFYGDATVTLKTVYKWLEWFRNGCESVDDVEISGRSSNIKNLKEFWNNKRNNSMKRAIDY
jgi:hypothetical protein